MSSSLLQRLTDNHPSDDEVDYPLEVPGFHTVLAELEMALTSRTRNAELEKTEAIRDSVMNYGVGKIFHAGEEIRPRSEAVAHYLKRVINRFEPRLTDVSVAATSSAAHEKVFVVQAAYLRAAVEFDIHWDDSAGRFYFYE